jgi:hypothetical protein
MPGLSLNGNLGVMGAGSPSNSANTNGAQTIASTAYGAGAQGTDPGPRTAGLGTSWLTVATTVALVYMWYTLPR